MPKKYALQLCDTVRAKMNLDFRKFIDRGVFQENSTYCIGVVNGGKKNVTLVIQNPWKYGTQEIYSNKMTPNKRDVLLGCMVTYKKKSGWGWAQGWTSD